MKKKKLKKIKLKLKQVVSEVDPDTTPKCEIS